MIRLMTMDDYEQVYDMWIHTEGMGLNTADDSAEGIKKYLDRNPNTCFVAEEQGKIVGAVMSGHDGRRGFIYHTTVMEQFRRKGIGKSLVETAMGALEKEGIHKAALVVFAKNESGNSFWKSMGFGPREDLVYRNKNIHELERIDVVATHSGI